jgi:hypothetical protein
VTDCESNAYTCNTEKRLKRNQKVANQKVAQALDKVSTRYVAMWHHEQSDRLVLSMSSNLKHTEEDVSASMKAMLVQDNDARKRSQSVEDLMRQFPQPTSGVKTLLSNHQGSRQRLVMRKLVRFLQFDSMRKAWKTYHEDAMLEDGQTSDVPRDDAAINDRSDDNHDTASDDGTKWPPSVVPSHLVTWKDKWARWATTGSKKGMTGQGDVQTKRAQLCWHYDLILSSSWSSMQSTDVSEQDPNSDSACDQPDTQKVNFHDFMSSDKTVNDLTVPDLLLALGIALQWLNQGLIVVLGLTLVLRVYKGRGRGERGLFDAGFSMEGIHSLPNCPQVLVCVTMFS